MNQQNHLKDTKDTQDIKVANDPDEFYDLDMPIVQLDLDQDEQEQHFLDES